MEKILPIVSKHIFIENFIDSYIIYFFSKVKQRNIMDLARRLTGFMMVGKPGIWKTLLRRWQF